MKRAKDETTNTAATTPNTSSTSVTTTDDFNNATTCPVCFEPMKLPIYLCEKGHSICGGCKPGLKNMCPICRGKITSARNFTLEQIIGGDIDVEIVEKPVVAKKVNCPYCKENVDAPLDNHLKNTHNIEFYYNWEQTNNGIYQLSFADFPSLNKTVNDYLSFDSIGCKYLIKAKNTPFILETKVLNGNVYFQIRHASDSTYQGRIDVTILMTQNARIHIRGFKISIYAYKKDQPLMNYPAIILPANQVIDLNYKVDFKIVFN